MRKILVLAIAVLALWPQAEAVDLNGLAYVVSANLNSASGIYYLGDGGEPAFPLGTGIEIENSDKIVIMATGTWGNAGWSSFGPGGNPYEDIAEGYPGAGMPVASLIGRIGSGGWFYIGSGFAGVSAGTGILELGFNDTDYGNNWGEVEVIVAVEGVGIDELSECQDGYGALESDLAGLLAFASLPPGQRRRAVFEPENAIIMAIRDVLIPGRKR